MDQAQRAQGLDQGQLAPVKWAQFFVAVDQGAELLVLLAPLAAEQHPEVLHGRAHAGVVQIDKVRAGAGRTFGRPEDVAGVAVAVQAYATDLVGIRSGAWRADKGGRR